jgi:hypothetical protein
VEPFGGGHERSLFQERRERFATEDARPEGLELVVERTFQDAAVARREQDAQLLEELADRGEPVRQCVVRRVALAGGRLDLRRRECEARDVGVHRVEHPARERVHAGERDAPVALEHQHGEAAGRLVAQENDGARRQRLGRRGHAWTIGEDRALSLSARAGQKVSPRVAEMRTLPAGIDQRSASRHPDWVGEIYAVGFDTWVEVAALSHMLEGAGRPGHFRGVATICLKLFNIVQPDAVYFGQKDAQQVEVLRRLVRDLDLELELRVVPTVRDPDGLALSSRNALQLEIPPIPLESACSVRSSPRRHWLEWS